MSWCRVALTLRQRLLGLAVEHDVDAGERSISEQRGSQPREQSPDSLRLIHTPQSSCHTHIVVTATLQQRTKMENEYGTYLFKMLQTLTVFSPGYSLHF